MSGVLHVITGLGVGGAEAMLVQLATALQQRGIPQHVVSLKDRGFHADTLERAGVEVTALGMTSKLRGAWRARDLVRLVWKERPQVLVGWMYHANLAAALAHQVAPGRKGRALVWNLRTSNMDDARYGFYINSSAWISGLPDRIVVNSQAGLKFHSARGFRAERMSVIPNGIDTERFRPGLANRSALRRELGLAEDIPIAIHVARVDLMKDHATFFTAMEKNPGVIGLLIGEETDILDLPKNVIALGFRNDIGRLHSAADLFVTSSAFGEGFSNALAEGMSGGLVPVATDVGDSANIVGDTGWVVEPGSPDALAEAISAAARLAPQEMRSRGLRARQRIVERFSLERAVDRFAEVFGAPEVRRP